MNGLMLGVIVVAFGLATYWAIRTTRRRSEQDLHTWRALADRLGLRCVSTKGPFGLLSHRLEGKRDGVDLVVDHFTEADGDGGTRRFTRVVGHSPSGLALVADVYAEHVFSGLGKLLGFQDVTIGDEAFDGAFVVKADDEESARRLLSAPARSALLKVGDLARVRYERGEIRVLLRGFVTDAVVVDDLVKLVVALGAGAADADTERDAEEESEEEDVNAPPSVRKRNPRRDR